MLSQVFHAQLNYEVNNHWATQIRIDLHDFGIPFDLEYIKSKSDYTFKNLVKVNAREYELNKCNLMKGSTMEINFHAKLEIQSYLVRKYISVEDAQLVFAYKTRMAILSLSAVTMTRCCPWY